MPNTLSLLPPGIEQITHDPTKQINGDPLGILGDNPYGEMTDAIIFGAVNTLLSWIDDATGLDLLGIVSPLEGLLGTNTGLLSGFVGFLTPGAGTAGGGVFGPLLGLIPGLSGGTLSGFGSFLQPTSGTTTTNIFSPLLSVLGLDSLSRLSELLGSFIGIDSPLNAANLFGSIGPELLSYIPLGHIGVGTPNLLTNPTFANLASILGGTSFSWDGTQGHNVLGSAKAIADGTLKRLFSNAIPVASGQELNLSSWVKWTGLTATGSPLNLAVATYNQGTLLATTVIDSIVSPATSGEVQLGGVFTVPDGVDMVRQVLQVGTSATAGNVWFSDAALTKTGLLQIPWVSGLPGIAAIQSSINDFLGSFDFTAPDFNPGQAWITLIQNNIVPTGLLATRDLSGLIPLNQLPFLPDVQVPGLGSLMDALVAGLSGFMNPGQTQQTTGDATAQRTEMLAQISAAVAALQAEAVKTKAEGNTNVVVVSDDFERVTLHGQSGVVENAGPNWDFSYIGGTTNVGVVYCDGHQLSWYPLGSAPKLAVGRFIGGLTPQTVSDYQKVSAVFGTPLNANIAGDVAPCYDDILGRESADKTTYVRARFGNGVVTLTAVVAGIEHPFHTEPFTQPSVGATGILYCGTNNDRYEYVINVNNQEVFRYLDSSHISQVGSGNRWAGLGMFAGQSQFGPQSTPGSWAHWLLEDNQPVSSNSASLIGVGQFSATVLPGVGFASLNGVGALSAPVVERYTRTAGFSGAGVVAGDSTQRTNFRTKANTAPGVIPDFDTGQHVDHLVAIGTDGNMRILNGGMTIDPTGAGVTGGYKVWDAGARIIRMGQKFRFRLPAGHTGQGASATLARSSFLLPVGLAGPLPSLTAHYWVTPTSWQYQLYSGSDTGNGGFVTLDGYGFSSVLLQDGVTEYFMEMVISGNTATVTLPDGNTRTITDSRIGSWAGNCGYNESRVGAVSDGVCDIVEDWFKI